MNKTVFNKLNQIILILLLGFMTLQTSCKKDDDTLNGTVWKGTENMSRYRTDYTMLLQESTFTIMAREYDYSDGTTDSYSLHGTYTYKHPNITLMSSFDGEFVILNGNVTGKQMTIYGVDGVPLVFTKQ